MRYLLDTNVCIRYLNGQSEAIRQQLKRRKAEEIVLCSVVKAELFYGALKSKNPQKNLGKQHQFVEHFVSLSFDDQAAEAYSQIRANLERIGMPIGPNDLLIGAIALVNEAILVTHNVGEFSRIKGLKVEDWENEARERG
jgi:tRNA(fMet)-specific endonuclease VapC